MVALQARTIAEQYPAAAGETDELCAAGQSSRRVVSLTERRMAQPPPGDARPLPTVDAYDQLLSGGGS